MAITQTTLDAMSRNLMKGLVYKDPGLADLVSFIPDQLSFVANNMQWGDPDLAEQQIKFLKEKNYNIDNLDKRQLQVHNLARQIIDQGTTSKWTGQGFGSPSQNARAIADTLAGTGITDIRQFGQLPDGSYGNKATGQRITTDYSRAGGNIFSGTFAGEDSTGFGVQFGPDGTPYFYTQQGASTSSMADIAPVLSILSIIPSPLQPFAAAANALIAIDNGNTLGGLAALAGIPGVSQAASAAGLANVATGIQTANQVVNLVNAIDSGNVLGAVATGANLAGAGSTPITDGGMTVNDALRAANLVKAIDSEDPNAIFRAASGLAQSQTFQNSLSQPGTTVSSTGQVVADLVGPDFVAQLTNPESPNYIGQAEEQLSNIINAASTQVASVDQNDVLQAIEDLRKQQAEVSPLDVLGQPLTEAAKDIIPTQEPPITSQLDVLGQPLTEEAKNIEPLDIVPVASPLDVLGQPLTEEAQKIVLNPEPEPISEPAPALPSQPSLEETSDVIKQLEGAGLTEDYPVDQEPTTPVFQGPMGPMTEDQVKRYNDEFAKYLDYLQAGEPPPPDYGVQDLGITDENLDSFNRNLSTMLEEGRLPSQWQGDAEGNYTLVSDDGSTITIGPEGEIVHYTEAPEGNLPGEVPPLAPPPATPPTPPIAPPVKPPVAPPTVRPPVVRPPSPAPATAAQSGMDVNGLLALLGLMGESQAQPQTPAPEYAKTLEFDVTKAFSPTLYEEEQKQENPYLRGLI